MFVQIIKKAFTIGSATFVSRILGFFRDILIAFFFGTQASAEAFVVAFRLPNIWRSFIGEEAVNTAVVPVLSEYKCKKDLSGFWKLSFSLLKFSALSLFLLAILGVIFAPFLIRMIAPGFIGSFNKFHLCVKLTRLIFPYIFLIGLTAVAAGIVISQRIFWSYSWAPVVLNLSIISSLLLFVRKFGVFALALGVILGGILELFLQFLALKGTNPPRVRTFFIHPEYKRISRLLVPRFFGAGIYQINIFVDTILASLDKIVGSGGIAGLYFAQRFVQLPLAVFATSLATAILPFFSEQVANNSLKKLKDNLSLSLRTVFLVMLPSSVVLVLLSKDIISTFLEYGHFSAYSTQITSQALTFYALGLFFYAGIKIMVSTFYSLQEPMTPVKFSLISLFINVTLSVIFMFPFKLAGLCLATSIAAGFNFIFLFWKLKKRIGLEFVKIWYSFLRIGVCSLAMGILISVVKEKVTAVSNIKVLNLTILLLTAFLSYLGFSILINPREIKAVLRWKKIR